MPQAKKMSYANGKIYIIRNTENDKVYIGSTTQPLCKRMALHRRDARTEQCINRALYKAFTQIGVDKFSIELLEEYPCDNVEQLLAREGHFIRQHQSHISGYNKKLEGRGLKEYLEENKEKILQKKIIYREGHKEHISNYMKHYYQQNKDELQETKKEWYEQNKERILQKRKEYQHENQVLISQQRKEKVVCQCGCEVTRACLSRHKKSQLHLSWEANNQSS